MGETTKIKWSDSTCNFWEGCTKVSLGCTNCYAEARDRRMMIEPVIHWGKGAPRRKSKSAVKSALAMNAKPWICDECGSAEINTVRNWNCCDDVGNPAQAKVCVCGSRKIHRRRIFSLSLGDVWDEEVPIEWLAEMLDTLRRCDQVTWILCSKRWENFKERMWSAASCEFRNMENSQGGDFCRWAEAWVEGNPPANIIGLCSIEDQKRADERIPQFITVPLACRGLSLEPLLGPVDLKRYLMAYRADTKVWYEPLNKDIHWLIAGGESGPNARLCNVDWIRSLVKQGQAAGMATFVKQLGANARVTTYSGNPAIRPENKRAFTANLPLKENKGGDPSEWPEYLRVREWPNGF